MHHHSAYLPVKDSTVTIKSTHLWRISTISANFIRALSYHEEFFGSDNIERLAMLEHHAVDGRGVDERYDRVIVRTRK